MGKAFICTYTYFNSLEYKEFETIEKLETKNNIKEIKKEKIQKEESGIKTKDIIKNLNTIRTLNEQN